jgi:hypothetical protein
MHAAQPYERSDEWGMRISASLRSRWASDAPPSAKLAARRCPYCLEGFQPNSGRHLYCTPQCKKDHRTATTYRITIAELRAMRSAQNDACAICTRTGVDLVVDHDHTTGTIRGLLCNTCNTGLGKLGDSIETLRRAVKYLGG